MSRHIAIHVVWQTTLLLVRSLHGISAEVHLHHLIDYVVGLRPRLRLRLGVQEVEERLGRMRYPEGAEVFRNISRSCWRPLLRQVWSVGQVGLDVHIMETFSSACAFRSSNHDVTCSKAGCISLK
jgi:hypothetical protein